jgi:hypothetical protein
LLLLLSMQKSMTMHNSAPCNTPKLGRYTVMCIHIGRKHPDLENNCMTRHNNMQHQFSVKC